MKGHYRQKAIGDSVSIKSQEVANAEYAVCMMEEYVDCGYRECGTRRNKDCAGT